MDDTAGVLVFAVSALRKGDCQMHGTDEQMEWEAERRQKNKERRERKKRESGRQPKCGSRWFRSSLAPWERIKEISRPLRRARLIGA